MGAGEVCRFFLQGKCRYGSRCRYLHPREPSERGYGGRGGYSEQNERFSGYSQRGGRSNRFEAFNSSSWQTSTREGGGRGRGDGRGFRHGQHQSRQPQAGGYSHGVEPNSPEEIAQVIREDMEEWTQSRMWPFSCYSYQREGRCLPGLSDVSQEELRWRAYQVGVGGEAVYREELQKLQEQVTSVRRDFLKVRPNDVRALLSSSSQSGTPSLFGPIPSTPPRTPFVGSATRTGQHLFSLPPSTFLFPNPQQSSFGDRSGSGPSQATFGGSSTVTGNLFGGISPAPPPSVPGSSNLFSGGRGTSISQSLLASAAANQAAGAVKVASPPTSTPSSVISTVSTRELTPEELSTFKADRFILGKIPETPPPPELI